MRQSPAQTTPHHAAMLMRGGRMTKWKGIVASMAPMMGSVSHLAVMALPVMLAAAPAAAQCTASGAVLTCSGAVTNQQSVTDPAITSIILDQSFSVVTSDFNGIHIFHNGAATLTQAASGGQISGRYNGVYANTFGMTGDLAITTTGTVTSSNGAGIFALQRGGDLTISSSGTVTGHAFGINTVQYGTGALDVTATGSVSATTGNGVAARSGQGAGDVTVAVADVTGGNNGVLIERLGDGDVTLNATGLVTSASGRGVNVSTYDGTTGDLNLTIANASGRAVGAYVNQRGSGAVQITSSGLISSSNGAGIEVRGLYGTISDITINVADVTGYQNAITANQTGGGDLTITASGTVTGTGNTGIYALLRGAADYLSGGGDYDGDIAINVDRVVSDNNGVRASSYTGGDISITATGMVSTTALNGELAIGGFARYGGNVTIVADAIETGREGIAANTDEGGDISITANGDITGTRETGYGTGISTFMTDGNTVITANGDISGVGYGIRATGRDAGTITINASGDITARNKAIYLYALGAATSSVTISGNVMGGYGAGVVTYGYANGAAVTITSSGSLGATSGVAFRDDSGNYSDAANTASQLVVAGTLNGDAVMGTGADRVELQAGARLGTGGAALDGFVVLNGDSRGRRKFVISSPDIDRSNIVPLNTLDSVIPLNDLSLSIETDVLALNGWVGTIDAAQILGFEEITLDGAADVTFTDTIAAGTRLANIVDDGEDGVLELIVGPQAMARFAATMTIAGDITNNGGLDLRGATPGNVLSVTGDYAAASDLFIGVVLGGDNSAADRLMVMGDTSGTTNVFVTNRGGAGAQTEAGIRVVEVAGTSAGQFVLGNGTAKTEGGQSAVRAGDYIYALRQVGKDWYLQSEEAPVVSAAFEILPTALQAMLPAQSLSQRLSGRQVTSQATLGGAAQPANNDGDVTVSTRGSNSAPMVDGAWVNISGATLDVTPQNATSVTAIAQDSWRVDSGVDLPLMQSDQGVLTGAISVFAGQSTLDATAGADTGRVKTQSQGIGVAATWRGDNGLYGDVRYEQGWLTSDLSQTTTGVVAADVKSLGRLASVEVGRSYGWRDALTLTPQAQLTWAQVKTDDAAIASSDSETLTARLGLAAEHGWTLENGAAARLFGAVDVSHVLDNQASISVDGSEFNTQMPDTTAALALGGAVDLRTDAGLMSVYGQISGTRALDAGKADGLAGGLGLRWQW